MILVNRNFGNPALSQAIGDLFKPNSDETKTTWPLYHTNKLVPDSSLVAAAIPSATNWLTLDPDGPKPYGENFFIVTEHFIKVLDKVYTKIWNESFTETGIYKVINLASIYSGFTTNILNGPLSTQSKPTPTPGTIDQVGINMMIFKKFVDRCIDEGVLQETDRLDYQDQIQLTGLSKENTPTYIDLESKTITFSLNKPSDVIPDLNAQSDQYLNGKKLYLMMTPYLINSDTTLPIVDTASNLLEPFRNNFRVQSGGNIFRLHQPVAFFKPKTPESKYGRSLPMATHMFWRMGTPEDKELAILEGTEQPDIIFDHLDRVSHIDSFELKIKFDKLTF